MWAVGRSVGVVSSFSRYSGAQIHSLGRGAFQAVGSYMQHSGNHLRLVGYPVTAGEDSYSLETGHPRDWLTVNCPSWKI